VIGDAILWTYEHWKEVLVVAVMCSIILELLGLKKE
jgi:hypothetical protein